MTGGRADVRTIRLEPRGEPPRWLSPLLTVAACHRRPASSARCVLALVGGDPVRSYLHIVKAAFGNSASCPTRWSRRRR